MILGSSITAGSGQGRIDTFTNLGAVFNILSLVSDAVAGYDMDGNIILANENLADLCGLSRQQLIGLNVRSLLLPLSGVPSRRGEWPFPMDGSAVRLSCRRPVTGTLTPVMVRAKPLGESDCFVVTVRAADTVQVPFSAEPQAADVVSVKELASSQGFVSAASVGVGNADSRAAEAQERTQTVPVGSSRILRELASAAATGDSSGVYDLLVTELRDVVNADASALYLAEEGEFQLKSLSGAVARTAMPGKARAVGSFAELPLRHAHAIAYDRLCAGPGLGEGQVSLVDKASGNAQTYGASEAPGLASFFVIPVLFDAQVVALSVVGWEGPHPLNGQYARMLDTLASHHATELMTAAATAQAQSPDVVQNLSSDLWMRIEERGESVCAEDYREAFERLAVSMGCQIVPVFLNQARKAYEADVPGQGIVDFPFHQGELMSRGLYDGVTVVSPRPQDRLASWMAGLDRPLTGFLVSIDRLCGVERSFLVARDHELGPVDDLDVTFFKRFVQDVHRFDLRRNRQAQETFISQTLQNGLGNNIQEVDGLTATAIYNSATETANVGGDFYDLIRLPEHKACIILGDVAGKGVQAASVSAAVRTSLGAYAWEGLLPAHMVRSLNDFFLGFSSLETFATVFVAVLDLKTGELTYCSAGHPPALLIHPASGDLELLNEQSGVVGAFREMIYRDGLIQMHPGDELLLYTDGVTEARKPDGTFFGEIGLRDVVVKHMETDVTELPDNILSSLLTFTGNRLDDDVALLALRLDGFAKEQDVDLPGVR